MQPKEVKPSLSILQKRKEALMGSDDLTQDQRANWRLDANPVRAVPRKNL